PRLPTLKTIPLEGNPVSRQVRLLAVQGRRYSPALDAFVKVARLRDWTVEVPHQGIPLESRGHTLSWSEGRRQAAADSSIASSAGAALEDAVRCALARYSDGSLP
ncbi:hypothetical protein NKI67_33605, partial [Mesorhizobium sp. M0408]